jgi:hypothetical protein
MVARKDMLQVKTYESRQLSLVVGNLQSETCSDGQNSGLSTGAIVGIVVGAGSWGCNIGITGGSDYESDCKGKCGFMRIKMRETNNCNTINLFLP